MKILEWLFGSIRPLEYIPPELKLGLVMDRDRLQLLALVAEKLAEGELPKEMLDFCHKSAGFQVIPAQNGLKLWFMLRNPVEGYVPVIMPVELAADGRLLWARGDDSPGVIWPPDIE